ncbi:MULTISPECIES: FMN-dependent NADH-azoreductase [Cupriavidus]|uniref:FMN-dependent NADH:quinone oxidoreductase 2 n=1 Tax=Cupriavidus pinatubonensis (strain JMP 134 / LMG 1197) TaxID=264198 RepID=AZOR2_CUPPJ|nr:MULTISPECIES: NAD(P)H-dependent oxidoreductase [Cupriavidus]Q46W52.1 RecName: Full=FMN-dependent NADH:quinone oxidoreductase 2; AltName: Full=Azo-dye reductase 2; AltName: Full=FMN-dependent NADH-azo compound oxidoreductase 2; AltName: Full=FMN-dependent NADH-azoreductase 2 [Cupriavidus pinatubonensis JMP134]TPQ42589.1 FMN-dependent NADH-azoreductase 2 [Cupriavidus pinatubonensis]
MPKLLYLSVSPRAENSYSRQAGARMIAWLERRHGPLTVIDRDLAADPVPHIDGAMARASLMPAADRGPAEHAALALSETLIGELEAADIVLISTPMHNFTVPSALKAWIDHVVRSNRTFRSTPAGKVGLLADRPVLAVVSCGGPFHDGPGSQRDMMTPYLQYVFGSVGITQVEVVRMENMARGEDFVARGFERLNAWTGSLAIRAA